MLTIQCFKEAYQTDARLKSRYHKTKEEISVKNLEEYRDEENDTYLSLRPRIIDLPWADFNVIPWLSVESVVLGEETFTEVTAHSEETHYQKGFAFEIEIESSEVDKKQVGVVEGPFTISTK